ncbi:DNA recombination protein RmuC [Mycoplasma todarodis]|uniref:DNA recombination protein RmuC n=1 Tax=Mycoplasma todarodis TaxID=1937191 RepID=UPI003B2D57BE
MIKINWFARLFMSWNKLEEHILSNSSNDKEMAVTKSQLQMTEQRLEEVIKQKEELSNFLMEAKNEKNEISRKLELQTHDFEMAKKKEQETNISIHEKLQEIEVLKDRIRDEKTSLDYYKKQINEKLVPLNKIEKTFFASSGNKGKGELGELQLKTLLQKSGLDNNIWVENLTVGKNVVEFAIQSGNEDEKWIPIDSKVLETEIDPDTNKIIVDQKYKNKVLSQVKLITKYLGKSNTADYGLLVLQNDEIYMELYNEFPSFFKEVIEEHKIYITSPSSFVQITWSIANIIKIYERVHKDEMIYDQMVSILESVNKFSNKLAATHKEFNIAMTTHYPTIQKKQNSLVKKLVKEGKIKELPTIENK